MDDLLCFADEVTDEIVAAAWIALCREAGVDPDTGEAVATPVSDA